MTSPRDLPESPGVPDTEKRPRRPRSDRGRPRYEEMLVYRVDNWVCAKLPTVNKVLRAELALMEAREAPSERVKGYRDTVWWLPAFNSRRLLEMVQDLRPGWRIIGGCHQCGVVSDDVEPRFSLGGDIYDIPEMCAECYRAAGGEE